MIRPPGRNQKFTWGQLRKVIHATRKEALQQREKFYDTDDFDNVAKKNAEIHGVNTFMINLFAFNAERKGEL